MNQLIRINHKLIISISFTMVIFVFLFRDIDFTEVLKTMRGCNRTFLMGALFLSVWSNIFINALRCREILRSFGIPLSLFETIILKGGSSVFKTFMPARTGEFIMVGAYLKNVKNFPYFNSVLLVMFEYFLNFLSLLIFCLIGFLLSYQPSTPWRPCPLQAGLSFSVKSRLKAGKRFFRNRWNAETRNIFLILGELSLRRSIILYTLLYMGAELVNFQLVAHSLKIPVPFRTVLLLVPGAFLLSSLPLTLGGLGVREGAVMILFAECAPAEKLLSAGLLYSFIENLVPLAVNASVAGIFMNRLWKKETR